MEDVQHNASRLQHHIHPVNATTGQREPLRSCLSTSHGKECKHGFPKKAQLTDQPLIVCEGIARERGLPLKGYRGMLGCTLGRRTCDSKNGTSKAFSAGCPGATAMSRRISACRSSPRRMIRAAQAIALAVHPCAQWQEKRRALPLEQRATSEATSARHNLPSRR